MKKYMYGYFNKLGAFFGNPFFTDYAKEDMKNVLFQSLFGASNDVLNEFKECELYYLGEFDNIEGSMLYKKEYVLNCSSLCEEVLSKKEVAKNEKC